MIVSKWGGAILFLSFSVVFFANAASDEENKDPCLTRMQTPALLEYFAKVLRRGPALNDTMPREIGEIVRANALNDDQFVLAVNYIISFIGYKFFPTPNIEILLLRELLALRQERDLPDTHQVLLEEHLRLVFQARARENLYSSEQWTLVSELAGAIAGRNSLSVVDGSRQL